MTSEYRQKSGWALKPYERSGGCCAWEPSITVHHGDYQIRLKGYFNFARKHVVGVLESS